MEVLSHVCLTLALLLTVLSASSLAQRNGVVGASQSSQQAPAAVAAVSTSSTEHHPPDDLAVQTSYTLSDYLETFGCDHPVNHTSSVTENCVKKTLHFLRKYLTRLDKGKTFGVCRRFHEVLDCLEPILTSCPAFRQRYFSILQPVVEYFKCACGYTEDCVENLQCFEMEYRGILSRRCDDYYQFNMEQRTHHTCYFLQERVDCKVALVSTACDQRTGDFAFHMYRFLALHDPGTASCDIAQTPVTLYQGFSYDANCPTYFLQDLAACSSNHLMDQMLSFDEENDLVATQGGQHILDACRSYKRYRRCIRHPRKACRMGTKEVFNYGINLRKYALKMDYICQKDNKDDYVSSIGCYQEVLANDSLAQCDYIYKDLRPWLDSVTAFSFYCREHAGDVVKMKSELSRLQTCYEGVFRSNCGDQAGLTMGQLIGLAFEDPAYLRYSYRPDCHLHRKSGRLKKSPEDSQHDGYNHTDRGLLPILDSSRSGSGNKVSHSIHSLIFMTLAVTFALVTRT